MDKFIGRVRTKAYRSIFWIVVISMAGISTVPLLFKSFLQSTDAVALVNGRPISQAEFTSRITAEERKISAYRERFGEMADSILAMIGMSKNPRETALENLIQEKILLGVADDLKIALDPKFVAQRLQDPQLLFGLFGEMVPQFLLDKRGCLQYDRLTAFLKRQGMTVGMFEQSVEDMLRDGLVASLAQGASVVTKADLLEKQYQAYAPRTFAVVTVPLAEYIKKEGAKQISDDQAQTFYLQENKHRRYWTPELRSATVWSFDQKSYDVTAREKQSEHDFAERFTKDIQAIVNAPETTFMSFVQLKNGTQSSLTRKKADDKQDAALVRRLFSMSPRVGSRTFFVEGNKGYVLALTALEPGQVAQFESVKEQVKTDMREVQALKALEADLPTVKGSEIQISVTPGNDKALENLKTQGIAVDRMKRMFAPGQMFIGITGTPGSGHAILGYRVTLVDRGAIDQTAAEKERTSTMSTLTQSEGEQLLYDFIASLREHATISNVRTQVTRSSGYEGEDFGF